MSWIKMVNIQIRNAFTHISKAFQRQKNSIHSQINYLQSEIKVDIIFEERER